MKQNLYVVAHRGLSSKAPENTYHSFDLAISTGCKYIEFDVQLTHDQEVVIIHDETIDRTSNGTGRVNDKILMSCLLMILDLGSQVNLKMPGFPSFLEFWKNIIM